MTRWNLRRRLHIGRGAAEPAGGDHLQSGLFAYIWQHSRRDQIIILLLILASLPFYFLSLDLPKRIINGPLQGRGFAAVSDTQPLFAGIELTRWPYLVALCLMFLLLVVINGGFKFVINTAKGRLGERMLRRLRYELIDRLLRFPPQRARQLKGAEVASIVKDEVDPLGGFIGDAYVVPVLLAAQAATAVVFILFQSVWLGSVALVVVGLQAAVIPRLRRRLLALGRERQLETRALAGRIGELVDGLAEIHTNDASNRVRAEFSQRLGVLYRIRHELYERKFMVKFINNSLAQVPPLIFYLVGGALVIRGSLDVGQLVAVLVAYKDLPSPIKELIDWDQERQDMQMKFEQVVAQLGTGDVLPSAHQALSSIPDVVPIMPVHVDSLVVDGDGASEQVSGVSFTIAAGEQVAVVGDFGSGATAASHVLAGLVTPAAGTVMLAGRPLPEIPQAVTGRRIGFVSDDSYFPQASIRSLLLFGLMSRPAVSGTELDTVATIRKRKDALAAGNSPLDPDADWIDYAAAGATDSASLDLRLVETLQLVELDDDIFDLALRSRITGVEHPELKAAVLTMRARLRGELEHGRLKGLVASFDVDRYSDDASIAENLVLGNVAAGSSAPGALLASADVRRMLAASDLEAKLLSIGRAMAETALELFGALAPDHPFLQRQQLVEPDRLASYRDILDSAARAGGRDDALAAADRDALVALGLTYAEPKQRLGLLDEVLRGEIVGVRGRLRGLQSGSADAKSALDLDRYVDTLTIEENVVFGHVVRGRADGPQQIRAAIRRLLIENGQYALVFAIGLNFDAGPRGNRLSAAQRQKISLGRAVLKRPDLLVVNRGFSGLGSHKQHSLILKVLDGLKSGSSVSGAPPAVFWLLANPAAATAFDRVLVLADGRIVEEGAPHSLKADGVLRGMLG